MSALSGAPIRATHRELPERAASPKASPTPPPTHEHTMRASETSRDDRWRGQDVSSGPVARLTPCPPGFRPSSPLGRPFGQFFSFSATEPMVEEPA